MSEPKRDFKGVWIPKEVWLADDIGWSAKLLLVEIDSLAKNGECFASNEYFGCFFSLSKDRISKLISELRDKGYVEVNIIYKDGSKQIDKRIITTIGYRRKCLQGIGENNDSPIGKNDYTPIGEIAEDNNTSIINTSNNTVNNCVGDSPNPAPAPSGKTTRKRFVPPTYEEVAAYCRERQNGVDPQRFIDYYTSNGWQVGKNKMKDWKAAVRTWERSGYNNGASNQQRNYGYQQPSGNPFLDMLEEERARGDYN